MKKILALVLCFCMLGISVSAASLEFTIGDTETKILTKGKGLETKALETAPFTVDGRTMVPVRVIAESFGAQVGWDDATQTVTVSVPDKEIVLVLGKSEALVNGESVTLDVAAMEQNGRTLVPLRFITETFGYNVKYLSSTQQIYITDSPVVMKTKHSFVTLEEFEVFCALVLENAVPSSAMTAEEIEQYAMDVIRLLYTEYLPVYDYWVYEHGGFSEDMHNLIEEEVAEFVPYAETYGILPSVYASCWEIIGGFEDLRYFAPISEADLQKVYEELYLRAKHILIPTVDLQTGAALSEEEVLAAQNLAQDLCAQLANGADFDALMQQYSQDSGRQDYPDGYVFTAGEMVTEFYNGTIALEVGEISTPVESMFGYHIIKRMPLPAMEEEQRAECEKIARVLLVRDLIEKHPVELVMPLETLVENLK